MPRYKLLAVRTRNVQSLLKKAEQQGRHLRKRWFALTCQEIYGVIILFDKSRFPAGI